jgi:hypothetical protein
VDTQALAQAFSAHSINGSYIPTSYDNFPGVDQGPTNFTSYCLDDATSQQIASMLPGAVVIKLPVESLVATNGPVPLCNWIQFPGGGAVRAADIAALQNEGCDVAGLSPECCLQQLIANNIPGGTMDPSCQYAPGYSNPLIPGFPAITPPTPAYVAPIVNTPVSTPVSTPVPVGQPAAGGSGSPTSTSGTTPAISPTPTSGGSSPAPTGQTRQNAVPATDWTTIFTESSFGGVPNWVLMAGIGVALFAFGGKR